MKKTAGILALAIFVSLLAIPRPAAAEIWFGFKGGINTAKITGEDANWKDKVAFSGGIFVSFGLSKYFSIQPEILYTMKGAKNSVTDPSGDYTDKLKVNYFEIPILVKFRLPLGTFITPFVFAGPSIGFRIDAAILTHEEPDSTTDIAIGIQAFDYGAVVGAGLEIGPHFWIDVRMSKGLANIEADEDLKNSVLTGSISIAF